MSITLNATVDKWPFPMNLFSFCRPAPEVVDTHFANTN